MLRQIIIVCMATCLITTSPAFADASFERDYLVVQGGYFDITQDDNSAAMFGIQYRYQSIGYGIRPTVGFDVSTDSALYGYAGVYMDIPLTDQLYLSPNFVAGGFSQGDGKDLGHGVQFRSGLELSYAFEPGNRLSVMFSHMSNASLGDHNPGAELLMLGYHMPLDWWR